MSKLELIAVVEIEPYRFSDREAPEGGVEPHGPVPRAKWDDYLEACRVDAGLNGLVPIADGSLMIPLSQLSPEQLCTLMKKELEDLEHATEGHAANLDGDLASTFSGGVAILLDGAVLSEPGCCCDLTEWLEWKRLLACPEPDWLEIWNGHDGTSVQLRHLTGPNRIAIRVGPFESGEWPVGTEVDLATVSEALAAVESTLAQAATMLEPQLPSSVAGPVRKQFAAQMVGLESADHPMPEAENNR